MKNEAYIARFSAWAPGVNGAGEWDEWARGGREIRSCAEAPEIAFTDSMFRRRLSQISKMAVQVVHDLLPLEEAAKIFFLSFRGELSRQHQINKSLIEEKELMPAAFSLSVFNAPAALATMAFGLKGGYSALFPGGDSFSTGLDAAEAAFASGAALVSGAGPSGGAASAADLVFVYADEEPPEAYKSLSRNSPPLAFGLLLSRKPDPPAVPLSSVKGRDDSPEDFLRRLILNGKIHAAS